MPHKLSLVKDQKNPMGWSAFSNNCYDDNRIEEITDNMGDLEIPVSSIPSPFAQLHLFETSFTFINKRYVNLNNDVAALNGNTTYHKYISHCLDLFEILFSYQTLKLAGRMDIGFWNRKELEELRKDNNAGIRTFADTLNIFINNYNRDIRFENSGVSHAFDDFGLIYLDNTLIAGTSPYTGFFTIGDALPTTLKSGHKNRYFFTTYEPLYKRSSAFQKFMNLFFHTNPAATQSFRELYNYIKINRDYGEDVELNEFLKSIERSKEDFMRPYTILEINNKELSLLGGEVAFMCKEFDANSEIKSVKQSDFVIRTAKVLESPPLALIEGLDKKRWTYYGENRLAASVKLNPTAPISKRKLPQTVIQYPWVTRNDFLSKHLVQLNYKVNTARFWLPSGDVKDIILPITKDYFKYFSIADLKEQIDIKKLKSGAIVVSLKIPVSGDNNKGSIAFERTYSDVNPAAIDNDKDGAIIKSTMALGIYPFFKVSNPLFNDRYKIVSYHLKGERVSLDFFGEVLNKPEIRNVTSSEHSRTRKDENYPCISNYVELTTISRDDRGQIVLDKDRDITFDVVHISIDNEDEKASLEGVVIPLMGETINLAQSNSSISFDIGTSNSFVALQMGNTPEGLATYKDKGPSVRPSLVMMHAPLTVNGKSTHDLEAIDPIFGTTQIAEFMPVLIGKDAIFSFPIRSIINIDNDTNPELRDSMNVLSNANIPFGFGHSILRKDFDFTHSNIKWGITDLVNNAPLNKLSAFVEQLVWMGRNHLLQEGFNPETSNVLWFKPLSMGNQHKTIFNSIWEELHTTYFKKGNDRSNLVSVTESWAPFYSYDRTFGAGQVYMNIDVGGGTTDQIVFVDNIPALTTSFRFAGNSLFESHGGNDPFDNGFVTRYESLMRKEFGDDFTKTDIIDYIKNSKGLLSTDLVSYFFSYNAFSTKLMLDSEFKLLFLLHNSAIFYHSIQILKMSAIDILPDYIGLSGNGARLFELTNGGKDLNRSKGLANLVGLIFKKIFQQDTAYNVEIQMLKNPKESTALGGIKGLDKIKSNPTADVDHFFISLGDDKTLIDANDNDPRSQKAIEYAKFIAAGNPVIDDVVDNVLGFFDFFFDELWYEADFIRNFGVEKSYNAGKLRAYFTDRAKVANTVREVINYKIDVEKESALSESLFFEAIKAYLYAFSKIIVSSKLEEFKGI